MRVVVVVVVLLLLLVPHENKVKPNCQSSVRVGWSCKLDLGWVLTKTERGRGKKVLQACSQNMLGYCGIIKSINRFIQKFFRVFIRVTVSCMFVFRQFLFTSSIILDNISDTM